MINVFINISYDIIKNFDCLYKNFPEKIARKMIEQDINTILKNHFDKNNYGSPIQASNWVCLQLENK